MHAEFLIHELRPPDGKSLTQGKKSFEETAQIREQMCGPEIS